MLAMIKLYRFTRPKGNKRWEDECSKTDRTQGLEALSYIQIVSYPPSLPPEEENRRNEETKKKGESPHRG